MRIRDSVVVITGASSGIGRATALRLAGGGAAVVVAARRAEALESLVRECEQAGAEALAVPTDVTDAKAVEELARRTVDRFGRIDVWVNNAAVTAFAPFEEIPLEEFRRVLDVNVMGYVHGARAVLPLLRAQGSGVLVNVASVVGIIAQPYTHAYSMSKAAIRMLGASLRQELWLDGAKGVHVCTVLPAAIDTPLFRQTANRTGREAVPMPPVYSPQRVARAIVGVVRLPRREVVAGPIGRSLIVQSKLSPGITEKLMAFQVDRAHLSRERPAPATSGNLFEPSSDPDDAAAQGGWGGRRRENQRRALLGTVAAGAVGGVVALRRAAARRARRRPSVLDRGLALVGGRRR